MFAIKIPETTACSVRFELENTADFFWTQGACYLYSFCKVAILKGLFLWGEQRDKNEKFCRLPYY